MELIREIGAYAGLVAFLGLALLALLSFAQGRDIRRLREWAGSAPERDTERKETTSAAAAERAEEMRRLEEAREAERHAAGLREERRRRREAGLPELTRGERLREALSGGGGGGWLGETRNLVAAIVVVLVLAAGGAYALLEVGGEGGGNGAGRGQGQGKARNSAPAQLRPGQIEVTVLNGTAVPGLAATYGDRVESRGFELGAVTNSSSSFAESTVMFEPGSAPEARRVSRAIGIGRVGPMTSDIAAVSAGAPVAVVVGEDNAATAG